MTAALSEGNHSYAENLLRTCAWQDDDIHCQLALGNLYFTRRFPLGGRRLYNAGRNDLEAYVWYFLAAINRNIHGLHSESVVEFAGVHREAVQLCRSAYARLTGRSAKDSLENARDRIAYILRSRGAPGFMLLGDLWRGAPYGIGGNIDSDYMNRVMEESETAQPLLIELEALKAALGELWRKFEDEEIGKKLEEQRRKLETLSRLLTFYSESRRRTLGGKSSMPACIATECNGAEREWKRLYKDIPDVKLKIETLEKELDKHRKKLNEIRDKFGISESAPPPPPEAPVQLDCTPGIGENGLAVDGNCPGPDDPRDPDPEDIARYSQALLEIFSYQGCPSPFKANNGMVLENYRQAASLSGYPPADDLLEQARRDFRRREGGSSLNALSTGGRGGQDSEGSDDTERIAFLYPPDDETTPATASVRKIWHLDQTVRLPEHQRELSRLGTIFYGKGTRGERTKNHRLKLAAIDAALDTVLGPDSSRDRERAIRNFQVKYFLYDIRHTGRLQPHEFVHLIKLSARKGNPSSLYTLGLMYLDGRGVPVDMVIGERLLKKASTGGEVRAMCELYFAYEFGSWRGVPQSKPDALEYKEQFEKAAADPRWAKYAGNRCADARPKGSQAQ